MISVWMQIDGDLQRVPLSPRVKRYLVDLNKISALGTSTRDPRKGLRSYLAEEIEAIVLDKIRDLSDLGMRLPASTTGIGRRGRRAHTSRVPATSRRRQ